MSNTLVAVNMACIVVAIAGNVWASLTGPTEQRALRGIIAALAAMYLGFYGVAAVGWITTDTRVAFAQVLGPAVWIIVWTAPAVRSTIAYHHNVGALRSLIDSIGVDE